MQATDPLGRAGTAGAVLAAAACPVCFPKIALVGALFGLGAFAPYESVAIVVVQVLFVVAFAAQVIGFRRHRNPAPLVFSGFVTLALFLGLYAFGSPRILEASVLGLVIATVWQAMALRRRTACAVSAEGEGKAQRPEHLPVKS